MTGILFSLGLQFFAPKTRLLCPGWVFSGSSVRNLHGGPLHHTHEQDGGRRARQRGAD